MTSQLAEHTKTKMTVLDMNLLLLSSFSKLFPNYHLCLGVVRVIRIPHCTVLHHSLRNLMFVSSIYHTFHSDLIAISHATLMQELRTYWQGQVISGAK